VKQIGSIILLIIGIFVTTHSNAQEQFRKRSDKPVQTSLATTHTLPSAFVIPGGTVILGTTMGIGLFDIIDITTNLFLNFNSVFNVQSKVSLWSNEDFGLAVYAGYMSQSIRTQYLNTANGLIETKNTNVTAVQPGGVFSYRLHPRLVGHFGVSTNIQNPSVAKSDLEKKTGYLRGTVLNKEFAFGLSRTVALAAGGSYDFKYDIPGAGASLHIGGFQIGAHYFFNVAEGSVMPIIGGGYTATID